MMKAAQRATLTVLGALAVTASLASASQAQRGQTEPPPMAPSFTPLETRVETQGERTTITFANRSYRIEPLRNPGSAERGAQLSLDGDALVRDFNSGRFQRRRLSTYFGTSGPNEVWLLPGFGLIAYSDFIQRHNGQRRIERRLIRAEDGALEPPVAGRSRNSETGFAIRAGVHENGITAQRTLFLTAPQTRYASSGSGAAITYQLMGETASMAWLFDETGLVREWSPLADLSGNTGLMPGNHLSSLVHHRVSDAGHVTFATQEGDGSLSVHVMSPDLMTITTHTGALRIKQRREDPSRIATTVSSIGAITRESREQNLDAAGTLLLVPAPGHEGWYAILEADGTLSVPGGGFGMVPISKTISSGTFYPGTQPVDYEVASAFVVAYQTDSGVRYGWASSELTAHTGPIWSDVRVHESQRLFEAAPALNPQLLLARFDEGYWRAYAEPEVHIPTSTWQSPNTFSGFMPPAASAEQAVQFAESVLVQMTEDINREDRDTVSRTLAYMQEQRRIDTQERMRRSAQQQAFWGAALQAAFTGMAQADFQPTESGPQPSALGPDFYWEGGALIHRPSGRTVE